MKAHRMLALVLIGSGLLCGTAAQGQQANQQQPDQQPPDQQQADQEKPQPQQKRPTLGPEPAEQRPTLGRPDTASGPLTSTTTDARRLLRVHAIYVEAIDNALSDRLTEDFSKGGAFRIVAKRNEADAVLRGTCFDSRRLKRLHSEVFLADLHGSPIWQDNLLQPYNPPSLSKAVTDSASLIVAHLGESLREAQRR